MKYLILLLSITTFAQGNYPIPTAYIGTYKNARNSDTIVITANTITWTSNENAVFVSYVDYILHSDGVMFSFSAVPNVYKISLERISRVKLIFDAQTLNGENRSNGLYLKQVR